MKIILAKDGVKREIEGTFEMCASREDLEQLVRIMTNVLAGNHLPGYVYGWFVVHDSAGAGTFNETPLKWTE